MRQLRTALLACAVVLLTDVPLHAQASLDTARQLYAAAEYSDALVMLDGLLRDTAPTGDRQSIELYRTLCLVAVNRKDDAHRSIEQMIAQDPLYRPSGDDVPPRLRAAFADARRRLLPGLIQQTYVEAKAAFDRKDLESAAGAFKYVLTALADPDITDAASRAPLVDLRTLAQGFHDLSAKAIAPPPPPPAPIVAGRAPVPVVVPSPPRVYSPEDAEVRPPVTIRQSVPPYPGVVTGWATGVIEVVIDEHGAVESATMLVPLNAQYDRLALAAARTWQYRPATMDGVPVKFRKRIQVKLSQRS